MASLNLTPREVKLISAVVARTAINVDWQEIATVTGINTSKQARDAFAPLRKKLIGLTGADANGDSTTNGKTPDSKPAKRSGTTPASKRKKAADESNADAESPAAAKKSRKSNPKPAAKSDAGAEDDEEAKPVKEEENEAGELMDALSEELS